MRIVCTLLLISLLSAPLSPLAYAEDLASFSGPCHSLKTSIPEAVRLRISKGRPDPAPGARVMIGGGLREQFMRAPPLSPSNLEFHEGNAAIWQENTMKQFIVSVSVSEPAVKGLGTLFIESGDALLDQSPRKLQELKKVVTSSRTTGQEKADTYILEYLESVVNDHLVASKQMVRLIQLCRKLQNHSSHIDKASYVQTLRDTANILANLAYRPATSMRHAAYRLAISDALNSLADQIGE